MKSRLIIIVCLLLVSDFTFCQQLNNILEGYTISKIPTNKSIVGAKWVSTLGATTEGLPENQLTISQSLNNMSLDKENQGNLTLALLSNLGLGGYTSNDLSVIFNKLEVYTLKDLYNLPLVKGEKVVFSSIKAASFDLIFNKSISANVMSKLPREMLNIDGEIDYENKKRLTIIGADLFVAHKIVKINKIETKTKSKKFNGGTFEVNNLMGYDFVFNSGELVNKSIKQAVVDEGFNKLTNMKFLDNYIKKYSRIAPIKVNITNSSKGSLGLGTFNEIKEICYCELSNGNKHIYPISVTNSGDKVTYDYFQVDYFWITYSVLPGVSKGDDMPLGFLGTQGDSKLSLISSTFYISKVNE